MPENETKPTSFIIDQSNDRPIHFTGQEVARDSTPEQAGRWTVYKIFLTAAKTYVAQRICRTFWEDEQNTSTVKIYPDRGHIQDTLKELPDFFGLDAEAKAIYQIIGLDVSTHIE